MIHAVIVLNNHGQPRMTRFYVDKSHAEQQQCVANVFKKVVGRSKSACNIVEGCKGFDDGCKLVYRCYATLCFVFVIDAIESELAIVDLIHAFVESLDRFFRNVCELDVIYNMNKVAVILDEMIVGGLVLETRTMAVINQVRVVEDVCEETKPTLLKKIKKSMKSKSSIGLQ